jgi:hypothetical protein
MATCGETISGLAQRIWEDINSPAAPTVSYISGWLTSQPNIGKLNNAIGTCFSGLNGCIDPELEEEELAIYGEVYKQMYWTKQIQANLGAGGVQWISMKEGDSHVTRASPTEVAKVYKDLLRETNGQLMFLVHSYKKNLAYPRAVTFENP